MSKILDTLIKSGAIKNAQIMSESDFFHEQPFIKTRLPILNIAFSGSLDGGISNGMTIIAGASKSFKTLLGLFCVQAYLDHDPEACAIIYDSEFGMTPQYLQSLKIDTSRIIHVPIEHIEQLKFDYVKRLDQIKKGDKVITLVDSLGMLPSKKEVDDAIEEKSVADMTRAKAIRSFFRITTPLLTTKAIPAICISHTYKSQDFMPKDVVGGGTSVVFAANQVFIISRAQEKDGNEVSGYKFTINIDKSRYVKEKSKLPFYVYHETGINKYSGLLDIALEAGVCSKPANGWYSKINTVTGEMMPDKYRMKDTNTKEFWNDLLEYPLFKNWISETYKLSTNLYEELPDE